MLKEIGSNFWIAPEDIRKTSDIVLTPDLFDCKGEDYVWLSSCRSAITLVLQTIEARDPQIKKIAYLPSFTCHTVFEPFINAGYQIKALPMTFNLFSNAKDISDEVLQAECGVVFFHRFFGFDTLPEIDSVVEKFREKGVVIIEDCTQSMYSHIGRMDADYFVGSIRKWCGVLDGGFAVCKEGYFVNKPKAHDVKLEKVKREACEMKYEYIYHSKGEKNDFLVRYGEAESILATQTHFFVISPLSMIIQANLNIDELRVVRRENYNYLYSFLSSMDGISPVFDKITKNVVPLYFPIFCEDHFSIQKKLSEHAIYAPIVWPKSNNIPVSSPISDYIYEHILCIPVDQRYGRDDMNRIIDVLIND